MPDFKFAHKSTCLLAHSPARYCNVEFCVLLLSVEYTQEKESNTAHSTTTICLSSRYFFFLSALRCALSIHLFETPFSSKYSVTSLICLPWTITSLSVGLPPDTGFTAVELAHILRRSSARSSALRKYDSKPVMSVAALRP